MALSSQQVEQLTRTLVEKGGYNWTDAGNAAKNMGGRAEDLYREFLGGGSTAAQPSITPQSAVDIAKQLRQFNIESNQPAIQTLQQSKDPLKQRYEDLLSSIRQTGEQEVQKADVISARELGRRGITTDSTFAGEYQQERRLPVQTGFQGLAAQTGLQAEQAQTDIDRAIALLQSGAGSEAVSAALSMLGLQQQAATSSAQLALATRAQDFSEKQSAASVNLSAGLDDLWKQFGLGL